MHAESGGAGAGGGGGGGGCGVVVVGETHTVLFSLRLMYAWMRCTLSLSL